MLGLLIKQINIVGAYLKSLLGDNNLLIFMKLLPGFYTFRPAIRDGLICRLFYTFYGLRQLKKLWNQKVIAFFKSLSFQPLNTDASILNHYGKEEDNVTMMSLYLDDFLIAAKY